MKRQDKTSKGSSSSCAACSIKVEARSCKIANGSHPDTCPTENTITASTTCLSKYNNAEIHRFACNAALQEKAGFTAGESQDTEQRPAKTRLEETLEFIARMAYTKIGLAFCIGLRREAKIVDKVCRNRGLNVTSAICKVGRVSKKELGIPQAENSPPNSFEIMCNPILQAEILNREKTEFNILLGLCVGHDSLFLKYAEAPCTVFAVKDRVTGHNPLAAIYTLDSYYRGIK